MRRLLIPSALAVLAGAALAAQDPPAAAPIQKKAFGKAAQPPADPPKKEEPAPAAKRPVHDGPPEFEAKFSDDSVLKVVALDSAIAVTTKYGKLTVPLADVLRVEVGFRFPEGVEAQVTTAVANLGAMSFRDREAAERDLMKLAEYAVPALKRAAKSSDPEVARRADSVLKKLTDKLPAEKLTQRDFDLIETTEITIRGRIEPSAIKVKTKLFGETALQLTEVRGLRSTLATNNELTVDAAKYAQPQRGGTDWFDTGIDVTTDQALELTATGNVDLGPNQPGQYISTPSGNPINGTGQPIYLPNGRAYSYSPGTLVGRIGSDVNSVPFVVGQSYKSARPATGGRLYLKIAPSAWGTPANGNYTVKVKIGG